MIQSERGYTKYVISHRAESHDGHHVLLEMIPTDILFADSSFAPRQALIVVLDCLLS